MLFFVVAVVWSIHPMNKKQQSVDEEEKLYSSRRLGFMKSNNNVFLAVIPAQSVDTVQKKTNVQFAFAFLRARFVTRLPEHKIRGLVPGTTRRAGRLGL